MNKKELLRILECVLLKFDRMPEAKIEKLFTIQERRKASMILEEIRR